MPLEGLPPGLVPPSPSLVLAPIRLLFAFST